MSPTLFCLHGFLGAATDWEAALPASDGWAGVHSADWLRDPQIRQASEGATELNALADSVSRWAATFRSARRILIGYSMGGRIALHALLRAPALWDAAVIISAHPGLASESERHARLENDREWARRFRSEDWEPLIRSWNSQSVFGAEPEPFMRREEPEMRKALARALETGSLGKQRDLRGDLAHLGVPVLWIAGEKDTRYTSLARECAELNPLFQFTGIPGTGHRAPWTANRAFQQAIRNWTEGFIINHSTEAAL